MKFFIIMFVLFVSVQSFGVELQHYRMSHGLVFETLEDAKIDNSHVMNGYKTLFTLGYSLANEPLVFKTANNSVLEKNQVLDRMQTLHFGVGHYINEAFMIGLRGSYSELDPVFGNKTKDLNDILLDVKWRFWKNEKSAFVIQPFLTYGVDAKNFIPTDSQGGVLGPEGNFFTNEGVGAGARLIYDRLFSFGNVVANLGYNNNNEAVYDQNPSADFIGVDKTSIITLGLGAYLPIYDSLGANIEFKQNWTTPLNSNLNPSEIYLGLSGALTRTVHSFVGVGFRNLASSNPINDVRISAGLKFIIPEVQSKTSSNKTQNANNSFALENKESLQMISDAVSKNKGSIKKIIIVGHTSKVGSKDYNRKLSFKRALEIKNFLISKGVIDINIDLSGKDFSELVSGKKHNENRRTEVLIQLKGEDACL